MNDSLLILDVDGVLTNGTKSYAANGEVIAKNFCDLDFTAIKLFKAIGWNVCWLSADRHINEIVAKQRMIDFIYARNPDETISKEKFAYSLSDMYNVPQENMIFVGDDLFDLSLMLKLLASNARIFCPANAAPQVKQHAFVLQSVGGHGVVMELFYHLYPSYNEPPCT